MMFLYCAIKEYREKWNKRMRLKNHLFGCYQFCATAVIRVCHFFIMNIIRVVVCVICVCVLSF
jgi:hypothetical protein